MNSSSSRSVPSSYSRDFESQNLHQLSAKGRNILFQTLQEEPSAKGEINFQAIQNAVQVFKDDIAKTNDRATIKWLGEDVDRFEKAISALKKENATQDIKNSLDEFLTPFNDGVKNEIEQQISSNIGIIEGAQKKFLERINQAVQTDGNKTINKKETVDKALLAFTTSITALKENLKDYSRGIKKYDPAFHTFDAANMVTSTPTYSVASVGKDMLIHSIFSFATTLVEDEQQATCITAFFVEKLLKGPKKDKYEEKDTPALTVRKFIQNERVSWESLVPVIEERMKKLKDMTFKSLEKKNIEQQDKEKAKAERREAMRSKKSEENLKEKTVTVNAPTSRNASPQEIYKPLPEITKFVEETKVPVKKPEESIQKPVQQGLSKNLIPKEPIQKETAQIPPSKDPVGKSDGKKIEDTTKTLQPIIDDENVTPLHPKSEPVDNNLQAKIDNDPPEAKINEKPPVKAPEVEQPVPPQSFFSSLISSVGNFFSGFFSFFANLFSRRP